MVDDYEVNADDLATHAANLARITAKLDQALDAANSQSIPTDAFGYLCQAVPGWFVQPLHDKGVTAVRNAIARAEEVRATIADVGRTYDQRDSTNAAAFRTEELG
jgi:hypothetical protein